MSSHDLALMFGPSIALVLSGILGTILAYVTGLVNKLNTWLIAHKQAALASAIANANKVIQPAITTAATAIINQISSGQLDFTNKQQMLAEASKQVDLIKSRVPEMIAIAAPIEEGLISSMMVQVESKVSSIANTSSVAQNNTSPIDQTVTTLQTTKKV
jgi:ferritin